MLAGLAALLVALAAFSAQQENKPANPPPSAEPQVSATPQKEAQRAEQPGGAQRELVEASEAAAGEDESAQFKQSPSVRFVAHATGMSLATAYWVCVALNFAVIAVLIVLGMKKALPTMFRDRTAAIQKALSEARQASEDANRRLGEIETRLSRLDHEIAALHTAGEEEARQEEERIRAATEEDRHKVVQAAEQEIAAAARSARMQLKAFAAELAVGLAENKISVGPGEDRELVRSFAERLGKDGK